MKLRSFIINRLAFGFWSLVFGLWLFSIVVFPQKIALIAPEENQISEKITSQLANKLDSIDTDLALNATRALSYENIFNLTKEEAKNLGSAIGCDYFVLLKADNLRRTSLVKSDYFESYIVLYLVSSRTGRLVFWTLKSFEDETANEADRQLEHSVDDLVKEIKLQMANFYKNEVNEVSPRNIEELPAEDSPEIKNFQSPLPYKRLRPQYTRIADLYGITATVEATIDLDERGNIIEIEISRWAGYELDESVKKVINEMQWRPASRNGKTLPIRVLLRYNFKKIEKDE